MSFNEDHLNTENISEWINCSLPYANMKCALLLNCWMVIPTKDNLTSGIIIRWSHSNPGVTNRKKLIFFINIEYRLPIDCWFSINCLSISAFITPCQAMSIVELDAESILLNLTQSNYCDLILINKKLINK